MRLIGLAIVLELGLVLAPVAVEAQPAGRTWRIGLSLVSGELEQYKSWVASVRDGLGSLDT